MKKIVTVDGEALTVDGEAVETDDEKTMSEYNIGAGLRLDAGTNTLSVNAASAVEEGNTNPVMATAVWKLIGNLSDLTTTAKNNLVAAINEAAKTGSGGAGAIDLRTADGYIQYSNDGGATITITDKTGTTTAEIKNGKDGAPGKAGTNGKDGAPGADGTTFTPSVSAAGDLSWTNDGGKANPAPVNLKGPQGETGPTGPQGETGPQGPTGATGPQGAPGKDYTLTAADKTEIAAEAAAAVAETSVPAPASAAVGQIVKVKAVDAAGKITETEAVDMPTGGSSDTWELITSGEMAEAAALLITTDADGAALALKSAQIIVEGATSFGKSTMLRFEVDNETDVRNKEEWAVEFLGDNKNDNPDIRAVYIAEQNKVPILNAESPADATAWASSACKVQFAKKNTKVNGANTYSFAPLTKTINRIYVGNYMGNGKLGAGCKYQIWGIRA